MKSPQKLQNKLLPLLKSNPNLHVLPNPELPWDDLLLKEVSYVVADYVNSSKSVIESDDPLREWLDEVRFYFADLKPRQ
jgi:hypothetical protein